MQELGFPKPRLTSSSASAEKETGFSPLGGFITGLEFIVFSGCSLRIVRLQGFGTLRAASAQVC